MYGLISRGITGSLLYATMSFACRDSGAKVLIQNVWHEVLDMK